jgi:DNA-3-methyladenine glycosylase
VNRLELERPLPASFFAAPVVEVARALIGCVVVHGESAGVIVEAEAYHHIEPACHAYVGLTARTGTLFGPPGHAYVYRSYGIHALLNAVAEPPGTGAAALIRALEPIAGVEEMRARRGLARVEDLCSGPGKLTQALGIGLDLNGSHLAAGPIRFHPAPGGRGPDVVATPRVGITKAAELPWRFCAAGSRFVSAPRPSMTATVDDLGRRNGRPPRTGRVRDAAGS